MEAIDLAVVKPSRSESIEKNDEFQYKEKVNKERSISSLRERAKKSILEVSSNSKVSEKSMWFSFRQECHQIL